MYGSVLEEVIALEWDMFSKVSNKGGKASCQSAPGTFVIMRHSQLDGWPKELLTSYRADLRSARQEGRNLVAEKYARMMESTHPEEYVHLSSELPVRTEYDLNLIEEIVAVNLAWKEEILRLFPALSGRGRALRTSEDTPWLTSFETYLRGELKTCSHETLLLLREHTLTQKAQGQNAVRDTLLRQARQYGYASLEEAEKSCEDTPLINF